MDAKLSTICN